MLNLTNMLKMVGCLQTVLLPDHPNIVVNLERNKVCIMTIEIHITITNTKDIHIMINIMIHTMTVIMAIPIRISIATEIMEIHIAIVRAEWLQENSVMKRVRIIVNPANKALLTMIYANIYGLDSNSPWI